MLNRRSPSKRKTGGLGVEPPRETPLNIQLRGFGGRTPTKKLHILY